MPDKILVVDDEVEIADLIEVYLNNENYSVFKFYFLHFRRFVGCTLVSSKASV